MDPSTFWKEGIHIPVMSRGKYFDRLKSYQ
jgi:hypothetical protein